MGYHVNIMQCMQPNFLLTGQVCPMLMSSVPHAWGVVCTLHSTAAIVTLYLICSK